MGETTQMGETPQLGETATLPVQSPTSDLAAPTETVAPTTGANLTPLAEGASTLPASACTPPAQLTPALTAGPYYTPGSPERSSLLEPGMPGTTLVLSGYVLDAQCNPIANAWLDFWQADANGVYDNQGFTLRGHQFSDANGFYRLETVVPGQYPGRTEHIHVKVRAPQGSELTSQLFFPGSQSNDRDGIYNPRGLVTITAESAGKVEAAYDFIIQP